MYVWGDTAWWGLGPLVWVQIDIVPIIDDGG